MEGIQPELFAPLLSPFLVAFGQYRKMMMPWLEKWIPIAGFVFGFLILRCVVLGRDLEVNIFQSIVYAAVAQLFASGGREIGKYLNKNK